MYHEKKEKKSRKYIPLVMKADSGICLRGVTAQAIQRSTVGYLYARRLDLVGSEKGTDNDIDPAGRKIKQYKA